MNKGELMVLDVFKYGKDINWSLPILFQYEAVWGAIFKAYKDYEIILPQVNGFGSPACIWTGGRAPAVMDAFDSKRLGRIFNYLKEINVTPTFTFSCTQLTKDDLKDRYANYLLDMAYDFDSHFIVYDDNLKNHIKEKYPQSYVVASVVKPAFRFQGANRIEEPSVENETNFYNELLKEYDMVVVRPEYSKTALYENPNLIDDISRIEVLINQPCAFNCPKMPDHYRHLEQFRTDRAVTKPFECIRKTMTPSIALENTLCHSYEVTKKLVDNGVKHLKIQGRGVGTQMNYHLMMLLGQIFKQDGPSYLFVGNLIQGLLDREMNYFSRAVIEGVKMQNPCQQCAQNGGLKSNPQLNMSNPQNQPPIQPQMQPQFQPQLQPQFQPQNQPQTQDYLINNQAK